MYGAQVLYPGGDISVGVEGVQMRTLTQFQTRKQLERHYAKSHPGRDCVKSGDRAVKVSAWLRVGESFEAPR